MITNSTFSDNDARGVGGAIVINGGVPPCEVNITNNTFSRNRSRSGGAIVNSCNLNITFSTFFDNTAVVFIPIPFAADINVPSPGSSIAVSGRSVTLRNTLLEKFGITHCFGTGEGRIIDGGYNIEDGATCGFSETNNSMPNTSALLDPLGLQSNGGPTETIALCTEAGVPSASCPGRSPAINKIPFGVNGCLSADIQTDQRGFPRLVGIDCDIGAFEAGR